MVGVTVRVAIDVAKAPSGVVSSACHAEVDIDGAKKINIETRRSTTPGKRVILVQGPC